MAFFKSIASPIALETLLEKERKMILEGNIDALASLLSEKDRLIRTLAGTCDDPSELERLQIKADRNQELLLAVARGIRSVSDRLEALKKYDPTLRTYDSDGQSAPLEHHKSNFERRA